MATFLRAITCLIFIKTISVATNVTIYEQYDVLQATGAGCYDSQDFSKSTFFHPPKNGTIAGIQLRHINGSVKCANGAKWSNWGCDYQNNDRIHMFLLRVTDEANWNGTMYYPTKTVNVKFIIKFNINK